MAAAAATPTTTTTTTRASNPFIGIADGASTPSQAPDDEPTEHVAVETSKKRKRESEKSKVKDKAKKKSKKDAGSDDDDFNDSLLALDRYRKTKPSAGQLENCEICEKRFTVTAYSKTGPDGGLLCTPCGKELARDGIENEVKSKKPVGKKRRKTESDRLDGLVTQGAKSLEQLCIERVADVHMDIDEFGDMPDAVLNRLSEIFSKRRVLNPRTLRLFLRPDLDTIAIHDAAYLEENDYKEIFAIVPNITKLVLRNACQFKDSVLAYMMEKATKINHFQVYAANLVTDAMWKGFFQGFGKNLRALKLEWLDAAFDDEVVEVMVQYCPQLERLKLRYCRQVTAASLAAIGRLSKLTHLSLMLSGSPEPGELITLIDAVGPSLKTLSLENCGEADDTVLNAIRNKCSQLAKFRLSNVDCITDKALATLFDGEPQERSVLPALYYVDLSGARDVDNNNPSGPQDAPIGLASSAFIQLMKHSGSKLTRLNIASCRHVSHAAFCDAFNGIVDYPNLLEINLSFCNSVDTSVISGIFKCCPKIKKLIAFGCFKVDNVVVPSGIALIGLPKAHNAIEQFGSAKIDA